MVTGLKSSGGYPTAYRTSAARAANAAAGFQGPQAFQRPTYDTGRGGLKYKVRALPANDNFRLPAKPGGGGTGGGRIPPGLRRLGKLLGPLRYYRLAAEALEALQNISASHLEGAYPYNIGGGFHIATHCLGGTPIRYTYQIIVQAFRPCGNNTDPGSMSLMTTPIPTAARTVVVYRANPTLGYPNVQVLDYWTRSTNGVAAPYTPSATPLRRITIEPQTYPFEWTLDPFAMPIAQPLAEPQAIPRNLVPYRVARRDLVEQSFWGPAPAAHSSPVTEVVISPDGPPVIPVEPYVPVPPHPGMKEKKTQWIGANAPGPLFQLRRLIVKGFSAITEFEDFLEAMIAAMDRPDKEKNKRRSLVEKFKYVYTHINDIDIAQAIVEVAKNEAQDRAIGAIGKSQAKAAKQAGLPHGFHLGPVL